MKVLLEVNVSGEASKHGFTPGDLLGQAGELLALPGIRVGGLMTMAPFEADAEATRPVFRALREPARPAGRDASGRRLERALHGHDQ